MSDLISRQAALDIIDAELNGWLTDDERLHLEGVGTGIECLPTIDPVKHGKWRLFPKQMESDTEVNCIGECSICRHLSKECGRFCNWCGSRMDGE